MSQHYCVIVILSVTLTFPFKVIAENSTNPTISKVYIKASKDLGKRNIQEQIRQLQKNMITISAGKFLMGDIIGGGEADERPVHEILIEEFKLSKYEVIFAQWDACVADGACDGHRPRNKG